MELRILMLIERKKNDNITFARDKFLIYAMQNIGCSVDFFEQKSNFLLRQLKLILFCFSKRKEHDLIFVSSRCKTDLLAAKFCSILLSKSLIVDVFISTYNTQVEDRKLCSASSVKGKLLKLFDKAVVWLCDGAILDTNEHIRYFERSILKDGGSKKTKSGKKYHRVLIGSDSREHPVEIGNITDNNKNNDKFMILYNGTYIPLHGVEFLLEAAKILESQSEKIGEVEFLFYGDGQQRKEMVVLAEKLELGNVKFRFDFSEEELQKYIHKCSVYLGIFGDTNKAKRVIPCKVYKGMAMRATVLSGESVAMDELFVSGQDYMGTEFANPKDIASKITLLKNDVELSRRIADNGYRTFLKKADIPSVAKELVAVFDDFKLIDE